MLKVCSQDDLADSLMIIYDGQVKKINIHNNFHFPGYSTP